MLVERGDFVCVQDLRPDTAIDAKQMQVFDPGPVWNPSKEANTPEVSVEQVLDSELLISWQ
jgi:hypothetical protein